MNTPEADKARLFRNAREGAELLDRRSTGWAERIDLQELEMWDCTRCILGQVFGDYVRGLGGLGICLGYPYGFDRPPGGESDDYDTMAAAWRAEIRKRLPRPERAGC
jgi:hypothetical protein